MNNMNNPAKENPLLNAEKAFDAQAGVFDDIYGKNEIINYKRERVRNHINKYLAKNISILEINAGTGVDAVYFSGLGHSVHATDISKEMIKILEQKIISNNLQDLITTEICSYNSLENLAEKGPYDCIFSNFGGLNCSGDLNQVMHSFDNLLKPGGICTLVIMPKYCLWEILLLLKGNFKNAFRRLKHTNGTPAKIGENNFLCWYYSKKDIVHAAGKKYRLVASETLCCFVPPSYFENFANRFPIFFSFLKGMENRLRNKWPWNNFGDYLILTLRKL